MEFCHKTVPYSRTGNCKWLQCSTLFVTGINRSPDAAERRCDWPAIELTGIQYFVR